MRRRDTVEVVAMLGESVVDVHRIDRAARGRVAPITWAVFAAGVAAIATAGVLFAIALGGAATDARRFDEWVELRRPIYAFRMHAPFGSSHALHASDMLAIAALVAGVALFVVAILRAARERQFPGYRLGDVTIRADAPAPASVQTGLVTLVVSRVPAETVVLPRASGERRVLAYIGASLGVHLAVWATLQQVPMGVLAVEGDRDEVGDTLLDPYANVHTREVVDADANELGGGRGDATPAAAMVLPEGRRKSSAATGSPQLSPAEARQQAIESLGSAEARSVAEGRRGASIEQARNASIFGSERLDSDIRTLVASADLSGGITIGGIYQLGQEYDGFGVGLRGTGPGGGGSGGLIAAGRYATNVAGTGAGAGYGFAGGMGFMMGRSPAVPTVTICGRHPDGSSCVLAIGDLDKAIIRRYIRRELPKIQYCYERQLISKHGLSGTVAVQFLIATDGSVATANAHGMDDEVSSCVAGVVKNIQFPKSTRGEITRVTYPFTFQTAGE